MLHEDEVLPRGAESPFLSALHAKNNTTNLNDNDDDADDDHRKSKVWLKQKSILR